MAEFDEVEINQGGKNANCPKCNFTLWINPDGKTIHYDPGFAALTAKAEQTK